MALGKRRRPGWDNVGQKRYKRKPRASAPPKRPPVSHVVVWKPSAEQCNNCDSLMYYNEDDEWRCMDCGLT